MVDIASFKLRMQKSVDVFTEEISRIRAGRATPAVVENVMVSTYGGTATMRVMELGSITAEDAHTLVIRPWDASVISDIAKSINTAGLSLNAVIDGDMIRIKIPELSEERRREFVKLLHTKLEAGKVSLRQLRQDAMTDVKKSFEAKEIGEDDKGRYEKEIQKITDDHVSKIDQAGSQKEKELMSV